MPKQKKKKKRFFDLKAGVSFENQDDILTITNSYKGFYFTLTSKHGLPTHYGDLNFGTLLNVLKSDDFTQIQNTPN